VSGGYRPSNWYDAYTLQGPNGEIYAGRTSGYGSAEQLVNERYSSHHMRLFGYNNPKVDVFAQGDTGYYAIRGREQLIINENGGTGSPRVGNSINGISILNPFRDTYISAAKARFSIDPLPRAKW
jgi:hypothetical protein